MALPSTGPLSLSQVNTELGRLAGASISLADAGVRGLAGLANGAIGLGALRGKSAQFTHTITGHQQELNLHAYAFSQDRVLIEAQQSNLGDEWDILDMQPAVNVCDRAALHARRVLRKLIAHENNLPEQEIAAE